MAGIYNKLKIAFGIGFGVGVSRLINLLPLLGVLDYIVVRSGINATRTDESGNVVTVGANVPRADFSDFACNTLLTEVATVNLYVSPASLSTQGITTTATTYTVSFYGTGTITFTGTFTGSLVGTGVNDRVTTTFVATAGTLTSTVTGTVTNAQSEAQTYATSYVVGSRSKDEINGGEDESFFNDDKGILFLHTYMFPDDTEDMFVSVGEDETNNFRLRKKSADNDSLFYERFNIGVDVSLSYEPHSLQEFNKIALFWDFPIMELWVNGVKRSEDNGYEQIIGDVINTIDFHSGASSTVNNYKGKTLETWYSDDLTIDLEVQTSFVSLEDLITNFKYETV